jgi:hypothetical protein
MAAEGDGKSGDGLGAWGSNLDITSWMLRLVFCECPLAVVWYRVAQAPSRHVNRISCLRALRVVSPLTPALSPKFGEEGERALTAYPRVTLRFTLGY